MSAGAIAFWVIFLLFFALVFWWLYKQSKPPAFNGFIWRMAGGIDTIKRKPEGQKPFKYNYRWYDLFPRYRALYWWSEEKVEREIGNGIVVTETIIKHWNPDQPADYKVKEKRDYMTPSELHDITDWQSLQKYFTERNKMMEGVKLGVSIAMVAICALGIIMLMDMLGKDDKPQQAELPAKQSTMLEINK